MAQHVPIEKLSIIICNFNYAQFVGQAIESALAVDWPDVEVIVVDDGSTDNSSEIIRKFERKGIKALFRGNKGQAQAAQEGFSYSSGDWILFLDADDLVHPSIALEASRIIVPGWSMIQFQMELIDATGAQIGGTFPKFG